MIDQGGAAAFEALLSRRGGDVLLVVDGGWRISRAGPGAADLAERPLAVLPGMSLIAAFGSAALDVRIGMEVEVYVDEVPAPSGEGKVLAYKFRPAQGGAA